MVSNPYIIENRNENENENENEIILQNNENNFNVIHESSRPTTPESIINPPTTPPRLRAGNRNRVRSAASGDTREEILAKYISVKMEIDALNMRELRNANKIKELQNVITTEWNRIKVLESRLNNIQAILFENSESIPNGLYVQLMDALIS